MSTNAFLRWAIEPKWFREVLRSKKKQIEKRICYFFHEHTLTHLIQMVLLVLEIKCIVIVELFSFLHYFFKFNALCKLDPFSCYCHICLKSRKVYAMEKPIFQITLHMLVFFFFFFRYDWIYKIFIFHKSKTALMLNKKYFIHGSIGKFI